MGHLAGSWTAGAEYRLRHRLVHGQRCPVGTAVDWPGVGWWAIRGTEERALRACGRLAGARGGRPPTPRPMTADRASAAMKGSDVAPSVARMSHICANPSPAQTGEAHLLNSAEPPHPSSQRTLARHGGHC